jgi:hypothetical protein
MLHFNANTALSQQRLKSRLTRRNGLGQYRASSKHEARSLLLVPSRAHRERLIARHAAKTFSGRWLATRTCTLNAKATDASLSWNKGPGHDRRSISPALAGRRVACGIMAQTPPHLVRGLSDVVGLGVGDGAI